MTKNTTNADIYELVDNRVDRLRLEVKGDIKSSFDDLSKQINDLSKTVSAQGTAQKIDSTKIGLLVTGLTIVVNGVIAFLVNALSNGRTL